MKGKIKLPSVIRLASEVNISAEQIGEFADEAGIFQEPQILLEVDIRSNGKHLEPLVELFGADANSLKEANAIIDYVSKHLQDANYTAVVKTFQQGRFFALRSKTPRNSRAHKKLILDWIDLVQSIEKQSIIESLNLKVGRGGSVGNWTPETRAAFLALYNDALAQVKDAKRVYKVNQKRRNWREIVKAAHPELPERVINRLHLQGEKPSDIALELSATQFGVTFNEYLKKVLREARREYVK